MERTYKIILQLIVIGAVLTICLLYFTAHNGIPEAAAVNIKIAQDGIREEANIKTYEIAESSVADTAISIKIADDDIGEEANVKTFGITKNNFCREFISTGAIGQIIRNERPGILKEVTEAAVANDSIFFLETSCAADLRPRQSCSVESAARTNPEKKIYVLFISPDVSLGDDGGENIRKLKSIYTNIHFHYVDIIKFTKGTKMEKWVQNQTLMKSIFRVAHLADGLRLLALCKYGGIYFDLDIIVMHSLQNMSNFAGDESQDALCNAVISMKPNGKLVNACLDEFVNNYRGDLWAHNGPHAIERALKNNCDRKTRRLWKNCDGTFVIYPTTEFYPIPWQNWHVYFEKSDEKHTAQMINNSMSVHVWNKMSKEGKVKVGSNILYGDLASKYCPLSYWNSGQYF